MASSYYYPEKTAQIIGNFTDNRKAAKMLKAEVDAGNLKAKELRQSSKKISFGLSYGAYPPKVAASIKCPLEQAEQIFDNYHNKMFPGITEFRENYVLPTTKETGRIHLGMGFYLRTDNPKKDIRTLNNAITN